MIINTQEIPFVQDQTLENQKLKSNVCLAQNSIAIISLQQYNEGNSFQNTGIANNQSRDQKNENPTNKLGKYKCQICDKVLSTAANLRRHRMQHSGDRPFECPQCNKRFALKTTLDNHVRTHTGEKPFVCEVCQKSFRQRAHYLVHIKIHTEEKNHKCDVCGKLFIQKSHYKAHLASHTGEKTFECEHCGKRFSQSAMLKRHSIIHQERKSFSCSVCGKKYRDQQNLASHLKAHDGIKDYQCEKCGKTFQYRSGLNRHLRQDTFPNMPNCQYRKKSRGKSYECNYCSVKFKTKQRLRCHITSHTGEKPYECKDCRSRFTVMSSLKLHLKGSCKGKEDKRSSTLQSKNSSELPKEVKMSFVNSCYSRSNTPEKGKSEYKTSIQNCASEYDTSTPTKPIAYQTSILVKSTKIDYRFQDESNMVEKFKRILEYSRENCDSVFSGVTGIFQGNPDFRAEVKRDPDKDWSKYGISSLCQVKEEIDIFHEEID